MKQRYIPYRHKAKPDVGNMFMTLFNAKVNACHCIMPNVHVGHWHECDALMILKSGYTHEVEIKVSRSDFKADFKKINWYQTAKNPRGHDRPIETPKHDQLAAGVGFPNRFSFYVPEDMITPDEIPDYAGLYYYKRMKGHSGVIWEVKAPKLMHKNKISDATTANLSRKYVFRYVKSMSPPMESYAQIHGDHSEEHF